MEDILLEQKVVFLTEQEILEALHEFLWLKGYDVEENKSVLLGEDDAGKFAIVPVSATPKDFQEVPF